MSETNRRKFIGGGAAAAAAATVAAAPAEAQTKKVIYPDGNEPDGTPLYVPALTYGNLVFVSGVVIFAYCLILFLASNLIRCSFLCTLF